MLSSRFKQFYGRTIRRLGRARTYLIIFFVLQIVLSFQLHKRFIFRRQDQTYFKLEHWSNYQVRACEGNLVGYGHQFVRLRDAKYLPDKDVFVVPCRTEIPKYWFYHGYEGTPLSTWWQTLEVSSYCEECKPAGEVRKITHATFAVRRVESHNLFHTLCEWYNMYLLSKIFNIDLSSATVLLLDDRPPTAMDSVWKDLFGRVLHHNLMSNDTVFSDLFLAPIGYESPLFFYNIDTIPFIDEFHAFFVSPFGIDDTRALNCDNVKYTVILRHDYVSHPERLTQAQGKIQRKFSNERSVLRRIMETVGKNHTVRGVLLENMSMKDQVELMSQTDVLIGIHGAGLAHVMSLPHHASVLEIRPHAIDRKNRRYYNFFSAFARWRGLRYTSWRSDNVDDSLDSLVIDVPLNVIDNKMRTIHTSMCPRK